MSTGCCQTDRLLGAADIGEIVFMLSRLLEEGAVMRRLAEVVQLTLILTSHGGCIAFFFKLMCCGDSSVIVCIFIKEKDCVYLHK